MHPLLLLLLVFVNSATAKDYKFKLDITMADDCGNGYSGDAQFPPLILKGARIVVYGTPEGGYAKVVATLPLKTQAGTQLKDSVHLPEITITVDDKEKDKTVALDKMSQANTQLYLYIDDPEENSALYFGASDDLYQRKTYADMKENPYFRTPIRLKSVAASVNGKVVHKHERNHPHCDETTVDWIMKAGIYRAAKCQDSYGHCKGMAWLTTYYDPYDGYVEVK